MLASYRTTQIHFIDISLSGNIEFVSIKPYQRLVGKVGKHDVEPRRHQP